MGRDHRRRCWNNNTNRCGLARHPCIVTKTFQPVLKMHHSPMCAQVVCVCAWNIWMDVKLLPVDVHVHQFFHFFNTYGCCVFQTPVSCQFVSHSRGQWPTHEPTANEATHELGGCRDWSSGRTCELLLSGHGKWLTQEPPCRFQTTCF